MPCTYAVATHQLYTQKALRPIARVAPAEGGVNGLICHDLDAGGRVDTAFDVASGGTAGNMWWVALRASGRGWRVHIGGGYKLGIRRAGRDVVESQPVYEEHDPTCCPSGGTDRARWHWNGHRLALVRAWHSPGG